MKLIYSPTLLDNGLCFLRHAWYLPSSFAAVLSVGDTDYQTILTTGLPATAHNLFKYYFDSRHAFVIAVRDYGVDGDRHLLMSYICEFQELVRYTRLKKEVVS